MAYACAPLWPVSVTQFVKLRSLLRPPPLHPHPAPPQLPPRLCPHPWSLMSIPPAQRPQSSKRRRRWRCGLRVWNERWSWGTPVARWLETVVTAVAKQEVVTVRQEVPIAAQPYRPPLLHPPSLSPPCSPSRRTRMVKKTRMRSPFRTSKVCFSFIYSVISVLLFTFLYNNFMFFIHVLISKVSKCLFFSEIPVSLFSCSLFCFLFIYSLLLFLFYTFL